jgi:hypothetical protein
MPFTDRSDLFARIDETAFNRFVIHSMRQLPWLFNYGTPLFVTDPQLLCERIETAAGVRAEITVEPLLPLVGTSGTVGLDFCLQITRVELDFHPQNVIQLPPELAPLRPRSFAFHASVCAGIACPEPRAFTELPPPVHGVEGRRKVDFRPKPVPFKEISCFCLDVFATGSIIIVGPEGAQRLIGSVGGVEIVDIAPTGLEDSLECYLRSVLQIALLPRLAVPLNAVVLRLMDLATLTIFATPSAGSLVNPLIENDAISVFVNVRVSP